MKRLLLLVVSLSLFVSGCGKKGTSENVTYFSSDDPRMKAAMEKARSNVGTFIAALKSPIVGQEGFAVKMAFTDGKNTEHMWLSDVKYDGANFHGLVNNEPEKIKTVKLGQKASVAPDKISDWMYVEHRKLIGGETLRVVREAMSPAERADFDKNMPFVIQ